MATLAPDPVPCKVRTERGVPDHSQFKSFAFRAVSAQERTQTGNFLASNGYKNPVGRRFLCYWVGRVVRAGGTFLSFGALVLLTLLLKFCHLSRWCLPWRWRGFWVRRDDRLPRRKWQSR